MRLTSVLFFSMIFAGCGDKDSQDGDDTAVPDIDADGFNASVDCDDEDPRVFPGAPEACNEGDDDCDEQVDEGAWQPVFTDADGDGHGAGGARQGGCELGPGESALRDDCDDGDAARYPGADEICDGLDNDCDNVADEDAIDGVTVYTDSDRDGYGDDATALRVCAVSPGYTEQGGDCDDNDRRTHPGADEVCDYADNDCDGVADGPDATDALDWRPDADDDGWAGEGEPVLSCVAPSGYGLSTEDAVDCDDEDPQVHPGAVEVCMDGLDNDCDGSAESCRLSGAVGVSTPRALSLSGDGDNMQIGLGFSAGWGDEGADGFDDFAVGSGRADNRRGAVFVLRGRASAGLGDLRSGASDITLSGLSAGDELGAAVSWGGDLNGDGRDDLLVGAPGLDDGGNGAGAVLLFAGPLSSGDSDDADWALLGSAGEDLGSWISEAGDYDGDGVMDFAVTGPGYSNAKGRVYLVSGPAGSGQQDVADVSVAFSGTTRGDGQDLRVSGAGDGDGDGRTDLLVGSPMGSYNGTRTGVVWMLSGSVNANFSSGIALYGLSSGDEAGAAVDWLGDVDGDGYDDLFVGAPEVSGGGAAYLMLGPVQGDSSLSGAALTVLGEQSGDRVGAALGRVGDMDGDGFADWLIAAPELLNGSGEVALEYGGPAMPGGVISTLSLALFGLDASDGLGTGVGGVGDFNGDGYRDFAASSPYRDVGGDVDAGTVYLTLGEGW